MEIVLYREHLKFCLNKNIKRFIPECDRIIYRYDFIINFLKNILLVVTRKLTFNEFCHVHILFFIPNLYFDSFIDYINKYFFRKLLLLVLLLLQLQ